MDYRCVRFVWFMKRQLWGVPYTVLTNGLTLIDYFFKILHLYLSEERNPNTSGEIFYFGWSIPLILTMCNLNFQFDIMHLFFKLQFA